MHKVAAGVVRAASGGLALVELHEPLLRLVLLAPQACEQCAALCERLVLAQLRALALVVAPVPKVLHELARALHSLQAERRRGALEEVALAREGVEVACGAVGRTCGWVPEGEGSRGWRRWFVKTSHERKVRCRERKGDSEASVGVGLVGRATRPDERGWRE